MFMFSAAKEGLFDGNEQSPGNSSRSTSPLESACCRVTRALVIHSSRKWTIRVATEKRYAQRRGHRYSRPGDKDQAPVLRETSASTCQEKRSSSSWNRASEKSSPVYRGAV